MTSAHDQWMEAYQAVYDSGLASEMLPTARDSQVGWDYQLREAREMMTEAEENGTSLRPALAIIRRVRVEVITQLEARKET